MMKKRNVNNVDFEGVFRGRKTRGFNFGMRYLRKLADANRQKLKTDEKPPEPKVRRTRAEIDEDEEF